MASVAKEEARNLPPLEIHKSFQGLINQLTHLFSTGAEGVINKELFPDIRRNEGSCLYGIVGIKKAHPKGCAFFI